MSSNWMKLGMLPIAVYCQLAGSPLMAAPADPEGTEANSGGLEEIGRAHV